ncbi:putative proteasome maturation factor Ump1, partial [Aspergillus ochraceoroseus]
KPQKYQSLRIAPPASHPSQTSNTSTRQQVPLSLPHPSKGAPSAPGLPDTLRNNLTLPAPVGPPSSQSGTPVSTHPLEARLLAWRQTQDALKMETLRRTYGIAEPVRRGMELKIVRDGTFRLRFWEVPRVEMFMRIYWFWVGGTQKLGGRMFSKV